MLCSKSFKLGFSSTWTENSLVFMLDLERQRSQKSNCQHPLDHRKCKSSRKISTSASLTKAFDCMDYNKLWKILIEMWLPDHLTCLLRNLYASQETRVRTGHRTTDWFQTGKGVCQACVLSPCLFNLYAEYIMWKAGLDEAQAGIKIARKISITSDMQMIPPLWQKAKRN